MLSMHENEQFLFEALRARPCYVLKTAADRDLVEACRATMRGETFLYAVAVTALVRDYLDRARDQDSVDPLTPRELEVLKLVAEGHQRRDRGSARDQPQDRRPASGQHAREARDARPGRADPVRDPPRTHRALSPQNGYTPTRRTCESVPRAVRPAPHEHQCRDRHGRNCIPDARREAQASTSRGSDGPGEALRQRCPADRTWSRREHARAPWCPARAARLAGRP